MSVNYAHFTTHTHKILKAGGLAANEVPVCHNPNIQYRISVRVWESSLFSVIELGLHYGVLI